MNSELSAGERKAMVRFNNYCDEAAALERKLKNGAPTDKQAKRRFRLQDIRTRLLPQVVRFLS